MAAKKRASVRRAGAGRTSAKRATGPVKRASATAPMSDTAIAAKTGRNWAEWVKALDAAGARALSHTDTAVLVRERFGIGSWWCQAVTVGYERLTGKRANLQKAGGYAASSSLTIAMGLEALYDTATDATRQRRWLPAGVAIHKATRPRSMRGTAKDGSKSIAFYFYAKGPDKALVNVEQDRLPTQDAALRLKKAWAKSLRDLAALAGAD
jgi:hypothetical protein